MQAHDPAQSTPPRQVLRALQATWQGPPPHWTGPAQAPPFTHSTSHELACEQSTPPLQEFTPLQITRHGTPAGQATVVKQELPPVHSITQVPLSQASHTVSSQAAVLASG